MLVPIVVLVCIVAAPGTFPIRAHGSMGSTPVSHACAYSCPGLYCSRTRNLPHQGTWFYTGVEPIEPCALMGKVPGAATIQTRTTIGTSMRHWSRTHRTMCPDGEGSWCGYNTDQDNYRHKHETLE